MTATPVAPSGRRRGLDAVFPAWARRTHLRSHDPTRNAAARGSHRRCVATRYAPYAQRCLGFLYLAETWIWMKSKPRTAQTRTRLVCYGRGIFPREWRVDLDLISVL